jgi:excisionase family DNA binding protein
MSRKNVSDKASTGLARIPEACSFLALSRAAVYKLMDHGELASVKIGKARRVPWSELHRLVEQSRVGV